MNFSLCDSFFLFFFHSDDFAFEDTIDDSKNVFASPLREVAALNISRNYRKPNERQQIERHSCENWVWEQFSWNIIFFDFWLCVADAHATKLVVHNKKIWAFELSSMKFTFLLLFPLTHSHLICDVKIDVKVSEKKKIRTLNTSPIALRDYKFSIFFLFFSWVYRFTKWLFGFRNDTGNFTWINNKQKTEGEMIRRISIQNEGRLNAPVLRTDSGHNRHLK